MRASTGVGLAARLCYCPGPHSAPWVGPSPPFAAVHLDGRCGGAASAHLNPLAAERQLITGIESSRPGDPHALDVRAVCAVEILDGRRSRRDGNSRVPPRHGTGLYHERTVGV